MAGNHTAGRSAQRYRVSPSLDERLLRGAAKLSAAVAEHLYMGSVRVFRVLDPDYPWRLRELERPPDGLWVRGQLAGTPAVAIVGTRQPSRGGSAYAFDLALRLGMAGAAVWSGGAIGIDAAAHQGALAAGARTIVVMGTGSMTCFPPEHAELYERIVESDGGLLYPFPPEQKPLPRTFLQRNAILAALVDAMVVVEAPFRSGARSAAGWARKLGRPLFIVPGWPWDRRGAGNVEEIKLGGVPLADETRLACALGIELTPRAPPHSAKPCKRAAREGRRACAPPNTEKRSMRAPEVTGRVTMDSSGCNDLGIGVTASPAEAPLSFECRTVLDATSATPRHFDVLCETTGLTAPLLQEALLTLTLRAVLVEGPSGFYRRINH